MIASRKPQSHTGKRWGVRVALIAAAASASGWPAAAQLLGRGLTGSLGLPNVGVPELRGALPGVTGSLDPQQLVEMRRERLRALARAHPRALELDEAGDVVVRGTVLAVGPAAEAVARAQAEGFAAEPEPAEAGLDLQIVRLRAPAGMSATAALRRLRILDPEGTYDLDPIYAVSGASGSEGRAAPPPLMRTAGAQARIGLIDTGVDRTHPVFAAAHIEQKGFASPEVVPAAHGTATASLIVGEDGVFRGAAPGASLVVADVYGSSPTGGAGDMLVRALAWTAARGARVVNMSLVGPPNLALGAAVRAVQARGVLIVAPVGNDGPAAPPAYPASYPGVVAVTGVDAHGRVLIEASHASHLDFAAPAEVKAANLSGGFATVRGTSFAAPVVAGRLAVAEAAGAPDPATAMAAVAADARKGPAFGLGLVAAQTETARVR